MWFVVGRGLLGVVALVALAACSPTGGESSAEPIRFSSSSSIAERGTETADRDGTVAECVDVDELRSQEAWIEREGPGGTTSRILDVRSGDLITGNFYEVGGAGTPGRPDFVAKIYWVPDDSDVAATELLAVRIEWRDDPTGLPVVIEIGDASPGGFRSNASGADGRYFWASGIPLPSAGQWRLTADAAGHHGCFDLSIPTSAT